MSEGALARGMVELLAATEAGKDAMRAHVCGVCDGQPPESGGLCAEHMHLYASQVSARVATAMAPHVKNNCSWPFADCTCEGRNDGPDS